MGMHQVLIVGGGVAGLELATALGKQWCKSQNKKSDNPQITLIDRESSHIWKPMLHTIAAGTRDISQQQTTYISQAQKSGFTFQPGELHEIDPAKKEVILSQLLADDGRLLIPERKLNYDTLIIAVGSRANDFGTPGVRENCLTIDSRQQAITFNKEIRIRILQCITQERNLSVAIVGGGATGVELAAELIQLIQDSIAYGANDLDKRIKITLIESGPRLLTSFPEDISNETQKKLEALGVIIMTGTRVTKVESNNFILENGSEINAELKVWAAGIKAPDFMSNIKGLQVNRNNQLIIKASLQTVSDPNIFVIGDCASLTPIGQERPLPPTAQVAHQQAQHLIKYLPRKILRNGPMPDFIYHDFGSLVSLGDYDAYGSLGKIGLFKGLTFRGRLAQFSHAMLYRSHQVRLHGFWHGSLLWLVDIINTRLKSSIRLD